MKITDVRTAIVEANFPWNPIRIYIDTGLVINGQGTVRIGGSTGETREVQAGDAVLWPAHTDHTVWTGDEELHAIVINAFQDKASR